jgi:hypothetical protein
LAFCEPHPGGVCKSEKEEGLEATELGSVYGKWEAWCMDAAAGRVRVQEIEIEIRGSHG